MSNSETDKSSTDASDKLAIVDALYRFAAGIDLGDKKLLTSAFAIDAVTNFGPASAKFGYEYPAITGRDDIIPAVLGAVGALDTTHSVSNPRIRVEGDKAHMDAMVEAQHVPSADHSRHFLMKNRYAVDLVRQGDDWVIQQVTVNNIWHSGDPAVLAVERS
jgi:hypothetical protein